MPNSSSKHPTTEYAEYIISGAVACEGEILACRRHLDDLQRQGTADFPWVFDESRANRVFDWFERCCRHVRGPFSGQLIRLLPFQKFDLGSVFGWVHMDTGERRFKIALNLRARGNVKSTEQSGLALYGMCADAMYPPGKPDQRLYEDSPEVECAAVDKDQAKRVWLDAKAMGEKSPDIRKRLRIRRSYIEHQTRGGWLRPLSKETKNKDSGAPCLVIIDEYHAWPTSEIRDVLFSGFGKRRQSLMNIISTAGKDAENSPCKKEYDIAKRILRKEIVNERYFAMIRELDPDDDPHDRSCWVKANPILREDNEYSRILLEQIITEHDLAFGSGDPDKIREWLIKRVNLWQADSEAKYFAGIMDRWHNAAVSRDEFAKRIRGRKAFAGGDLSKRIDLTGLGFVIPLDGGKFAVCAHGFMPDNTATKHEHTDRVPYRAWAREHWCTLTPGDVTDDDEMLRYIEEWEQANEVDVTEFAHDPYAGWQIVKKMQAEGYACVEMPQQMRHLSEPTKWFREQVLKGNIIHDGSPLLAWAISNAYEISDTKGNIMLSKRNKDDSQRIDPLAACINACARAMVQDTAPKISVYDDPTVEVWA